MRKLIGVGLILASMGLFFLFSFIGLGPYLRYTIITFGIGAGIFMMVADGIISAFQGQDLAGLDQYLSEKETAESGLTPETGESSESEDPMVSENGPIHKVSDHDPINNNSENDLINEAAKQRDL